MRYPWARFWYYCRAIDTAGTGLIAVSWSEAKQLLDCASSTLYYWLREAREAGAIYGYKRTRDRLRIRLGGLYNVCQTLKLKSWGATAMMPLEKVLSECRKLATAIATQQLQSQSRYAARKMLSKNEQKFFTMPTALDVIRRGQNASLKPDRGATKIPFLLHVGAKRAFVSKGFIPFGVSQEAIGSELAISDRTVRRHLAALDVPKRQLCQAKHAYRLIRASVQWEADNCLAEPNIWYQWHDDGILLHEPNGLTSSRCRTKIAIDGNRLTSGSGRFFSYYGKTWLYRCNLYGLTYDLKKMRVARKRYRRSLESSQSNLSKKNCAMAGCRSNN